MSKELPISSFFTLFHLRNTLERKVHGKSFSVSVRPVGSLVGCSGGERGQTKGDLVVRSFARSLGRSVGRPKNFFWPARVARTQISRAFGKEGEEEGEEEPTRFCTLSLSFSPAFGTESHAFCNFLSPVKILLPKGKVVFWDEAAARIAMKPRGRRLLVFASALLCSVLPSGGTTQLPDLPSFCKDLSPTKCPQVVGSPTTWENHERVLQQHRSRAAAATAAAAALRTDQNRSGRFQSRDDSSSSSTGIIRTIRVALQPDRDSFLTTTSERESLYQASATSLLPFTFSSPSVIAYMS